VIGSDRLAIRVAFVTGAGEGIGAEIVRRFAAEVTKVRVTFPRAENTQAS
jgi:NAD(P)-dependent dehydrogenase (short-subunit alcohol dehydrogenase family)